MTEMISQCPKCMTSFRVTEDQLTVAGGKVRCGYCMNVFMGQDYLISGGEQGSGMADEDILRTLLDGDGESAAVGSSDPPLSSGIEAYQHYDIDSSLAESTGEDAASISFDEVSLYDEPSEFEAGSAAAQNTVDTESDLGLIAGKEVSVSSADDIFSEPEETVVLSEDTLVEDDGSLSEAEDFLSPAEGYLPAAEGSTQSKASADLIEPDISLIEESLKFDEDDLRNSTDEDWALELLAELEGTGKYKDSTEASDAYVKELLEDTENSLVDSKNVSDSNTASTGNHRSGLGFEEIVVDVIPPSDEDLPGDNADVLRDLENDASVSAQPQAPVSSEADDSSSEFSAEFNSANSAPALGQTDAIDAEGTAATDTESAQEVRHESSATEELLDSDLFEDPSSVYQETSEPDLAAPQPEASVTAQTIDELINEEDEEPKRRKTDFLPHDIDISQSPAGTTTAENFIEWKWIAGSLGMVLLMLLQYSYFYWDDLTASAKTRPMFESMCNVVGCELPPYRNLRSVKTDQLSVRSHPDSETALIVDIILTNKAQLAQPFPVLQLTFFDIRSQPVATRKFFPNEYLDGELRGLSSMPSENPIRLALEIMDPGADAINYELNLLPTL